MSPLKRQGTVILVSRHLCSGHTVEDEKQAAEATVTFSSLAPDAQPLGTVTARLRPDLLFISSHAEDEVKKQREDAGSPLDFTLLLEPILTLSPIAAALNMSEDPLSRQKLLTHTNVGLLEVSPLKRQGTVILVSRHLCITAGHTVEDEKQAAEATVTFSSLAPDAQPLGTVTARLRPDLLFISSHAEDEVKKQREDAGSPLDFTLVAIDLPADVAGSVPRLGLETLLAPSATQLAVQAGRTQVQVVGCLASKCDGKPSAYDARPVIRYGNEGEDDWRYPLHYGTSTLPGHSGGAVVDAATWQLLAMHQRFGRDENCNVGLLLRVLFHHVMRIHDSPRELSRRATSGHVDTPQLQQLRQERIDELHRVAQSQL